MSQPPDSSLRDIVLGAGAGAAAGPWFGQGGGHDARRLADWLVAGEAGGLLADWLGLDALAGLLAGGGRRLRAALDRDIAAIDRLIGLMVDEILHHPAFQKLEALWCGTAYVVDNAARAKEVKIRILNVRWSEITRDADQALDFDQSRLFDRVYTEEFGTPGGEPFGLMVVDHPISHRPQPGQSTDDISTLRSLSAVAAASFCPFIFSASPTLFGVDSFRELGMATDLATGFNQPEYTRWRSLRETEDARFLGIAVPRILMRAPYADDGSRNDGFRYAESTRQLDGSGHLWGGAGFAFAAVVIRAYANYNWFGDIRGADRDGDVGGLLTDLRIESFATDRKGLVPKPSMDVAIGDIMERELAELGFIPLKRAVYTPFSVFQSNQSAQKPKVYRDVVNATNARLSAMIQSMLCTGRFAHYLKVICRDKVGGFMTAGECETYLTHWLSRYTTATTDLPPDTRARYPLRESRVEVTERPSKPGEYHCTIHLRPHFQLDEVNSAFRLVTTITSGQAA
ncbi:type VI secretion system contractile sheath large subunit [Zavarzinia compransoris]|uniref:Type VI secretion system contractile sheath large subunit n=1 Tax=Zavarzinia compransoris TaxID=1264899 RepID=A0A317E5N1_9PROT|nr:type VI secretion system contractile sheath large subunit [Zavarzinia compransoris]PWR22329.1 type VI secretion system contractile sheath large subunit [Zavarzinia compransoris]TDP46905.1 type VI secretion system protein ImpD [Zavarzinia compransoris]